MKATIYKELSNKQTPIELQAGLTVQEALPDLDLENAIIVINGRIENYNYVLQENDKVTIRLTPSGMELLIVGGILLAFGGIIGGVLVGNAIYNTRREAEKAKAELEKMKKLSNRPEVDNRPFLRGASNTIATGANQPYIIGRHFFTPYLLSQPFYEITGADGIDQYIYTVLECGFNKQVLKKIAIDDVTIKTFTDTAPQEGGYDLDTGIFAEGGKIEIAQGGELLSEIPALNYKVDSKTCNDQIPHDSEVAEGKKEYLTYTLNPYAMNVDIAITFPYGLYAFDDKGDKIETQLTITPQYSLDGGSSWDDFTFNNNGVQTNLFKRNISTQELRYVAHKDFTAEHYQALKANNQTAIYIRVRSNGNKDSAIKNDCYCLFHQSKCFDPDKSTDTELVPCKIIEDRERAFCTILGLKLKASKINEDKLKKINVITQGIARTWTGAKWSEEKSETRNPAAWALEIETSDSHPASRYNDDELDLESFGEFYEYCEDKGYKFDWVITQNVKKDDTLNHIMEATGACIYMDIYGRRSIAIDKPQENALAVYNPQNIISIQNKKTFSRRTDGLRIKYVNSKDDLYQEDTYLLMREVNGKPLEITPDSIIKDINITGITTFEHIVKHARRLMAIEALRPKTTIIEVGNEGVFYTPYSKILIQDDSLKIGIGKGYTIASVEWEGLLLKKIYTNEPLTLEATETYGIIVNCFTEKGVYPLPIKVAGDGETNELLVLTEIKAGSYARPDKGNVFSLGEIGMDGEFTKVSTPYIISQIKRSDKGFNLELVNYNEAIYESGTIPDYKSNITQRKSTIKKSIPPNLNAKDGKDGLTHYTWIKFAKDANGTDMSDYPDDTRGFMGISENNLIREESDDPTDYKWIDMRGKDGIAGAPGKDGKPKFTWVKYADSATGAGMSDSPQGKAYIGFAFNKDTQTESSEPADYHWQRVKGEQGERGLQGLQGDKGDRGIQGEKGADGKTSYTHIAYADTETGGGFSQSPNGKKYIGVYTDFEQSDASNPSKYKWSLIKGADGAQGIPGKAGEDGKSSYLHVAYATSADGTQGFDIVNSTGKTYIGTYTDFIQADSTSPSKYKWSKIKGEQGVQGIPGKDGSTKFLASLTVQGDYENQIGTYQGQLYRWTNNKWELLNAVMPLNPICAYDFAAVQYKTILTHGRIESTGVYGFKYFDISPYKGLTVKITISGYKIGEGGGLVCFLYEPDWNWCPSIEINSFTEETKSKIVSLPTEYKNLFIGIYHYPSNNMTNKVVMTNFRIETISDSQAIDSSGNGIHSRIVGDVEKVKDDKVGMALKFNKGFLKRSHQDFIGVGKQWAHSRWVKIDDSNLNNESYVFSYGWFDYFNLLYQSIRTENSRSGAICAVEINPQILTNKLTHLIVQTDLQPTFCKKEIYINGKLYASKRVDGDFSKVEPQNNTDMTYENSYTKGSLGTLLFFDRLLTDQEALWLYLNPQYPVKNYTLADWSISPDNPDNVLASVTPKYLGVVETVPSTRTAVIIKGERLGAVDANPGDWVLSGKTIGGWKVGVCYRWSGLAWKPLEPEVNYAEDYQACLLHMFEIEELKQQTGHYGALFAQKLIAQEAFIKELSSDIAFLKKLVVKKLHIDSVDGTHQDFEAWFDETTGLKINNGGEEIFSVDTSGNVYAKNATLTDAYFNGNIVSGPLELLNAEPTSTIYNLISQTTARSICEQYGGIDIICENRNGGTPVHRFITQTQSIPVRVPIYEMDYNATPPKLKFVRWEIGMETTYIVRIFTDIGERIYKNDEKITENYSLSSKKGSKTLKLKNLPTTKPTTKGVVWVDNEVLKIS